MTYLLSLIKSTEEANCQRILDLIDPDPNARVVDLGCGDGELTNRFKVKCGVTGILGVDSSPDALRKASLAGIDVLNADLNHRLPFADESFDVVIANQIIEHLVQTDIFVLEIRRILKPGGYAIVSTPNLASLHNIFSLILGKQPSTAHVSNEYVLGNSLDPQDGIRHSRSHFRIFTPSSLFAMFRLYGLRVKTLVGAGYYPFPDSLSRKLEKIDKTHSVYISIKAGKD